MGTSDVQFAASRLATRLEQMGIPYAICGGLAVSAWGHRRTTADVDIVLTPEGLATFKAEAVVRDVERRTPVDLWPTGASPGGDGRSVRYPHPRGNAVTIDGKQFLDLPRLLEVKLASGLSVPSRLQDFADVIALVRANTRPEAYAELLHADVRAKYRELWGLAQHPRGEY